MVEYEIKELLPGLTLIGGDGATAYLLEGKEEGLLIDASFGNGNIRSKAEALIGKPVTAVCSTHGHFDHTGGNGYFKTAFMSAEAHGIAKEGCRKRELANYDPLYNVVHVAPGNVIDAGGNRLEVFALGIHSPGSLAYLDRSRRVLFTGDDIAPMAMLLYKIDTPQPSLYRFMLSLAKLLAVRTEYDYVCAGHGDRLYEASMVNHVMEAVLRVLDGEEGEPVKAMAPKPDKNGHKPDFVMPEPAFKRKVSYKGISFVYDTRYVFDLAPHTGLKGT